MNVFGSIMAHQAASEAASASRTAGKARDSMVELEARLDRALLASEAMWTILQDKLGVTEEDLITRINEIDMLDGKLDGKVQRTAVSCPKCNRVIARRFPKCMYCGQMVVHDAFA